jgi:HK97 family phage major capsid protein
MPDGGINIDIVALAADLKTAADAVKRSADLTNTELKNLGDTTSETKRLADEAVVKHTELSARMADLEQKMVRRTFDDEHGGPQYQSLGDMVAENDAVKALCAAGRGRASVQVKAIISSLTTDANGSAGDLIVPQRKPGILPPVIRRLTIRDLIQPGQTNSTSIQYVKETGFTNSAASVSETAGTTKPQSEIKFDIATTTVTTLAHWVLATKQILSDVPQLKSYINGRLLYGLKYVEEAQLLMGGGTGTDLNGIYTQSTAYSAPFSYSGATMIDQLRLAILQSHLAELPPNGIVLHPSDWTHIELTKTDDGAYLFANPTSIVSPTLWGLPVVATQAMTIDKFLIGPFNTAAQIFDRWEADVLISTEDDTNFRKNLVTILAEERLALAVFRPEAFINGDFGNV